MVSRRGVSVKSPINHRRKETLVPSDNSESIYWCRHRFYCRKRGCICVLGIGKGDEMVEDIEEQRK